MRVTTREPSCSKSIYADRCAWLCQERSKLWCVTSTGCRTPTTAPYQTGYFVTTVPARFSAGVYTAPSVDVDATTAHGVSAFCKYSSSPCAYRSIRLGYNVLMMDSDVVVMHDPYKYFKHKPFKDITVMNQAESPVDPNGGVLYVQNAAPDGPAAFMFAGKPCASALLTALWYVLIHQP